MLGQLGAPLWCLDPTHVIIPGHEKNANVVWEFEGWLVFFVLH